VEDAVVGLGWACTWRLRCALEISEMERGDVIEFSVRVDGVLEAVEII
jgi:hypothetical protein